MKWRAITAIARKDIVDAVRNMHLLFALLLPVGLSLLFSLAFPGPDQLGTLTVAVYDPGGSRLVAALRTLPQVRLLDIASSEELPAVAAGKAVGGLAVPAGFDAAVAAGQQPELKVYLNSRRGGGERAAFQRLVERQVWALARQEIPAHIVESSVGGPLAIAGQGQQAFDSYFLVMLLVMSLAMTGTYMVPVLLVEEKEKHTLETLLVSPAGEAEVVAGKAIAGLVYSLLIAGVLLVLNRGWMGAWPLTALAVLVGGLFVVAVGLLLGGLFRNMAQVNTWSSIVMLLLLFPSWLTIVQVPAPLEMAFRLIPTHYLAQALGWAAAGGASPGRVWGNLAVLAACAVVTLAVVVWRLRREEG